MKSTGAIFGLSLCAVALAFWVRWLLDPLVGNLFPYATFVIAVTLSAWIGGWRPALLCIFLGIVLAQYFFVPPRYSLVPVGIQHWGGLLFFLTIGLVIASFGEGMRAAQRRELQTERDVRQQAESLQAGQRQVLESIALGRTLPETLPMVCRVIEEHEPGLLCSILLIDEQTQYTGAGYGHRLPASYLQSQAGIHIGAPYTGSCCEALDTGHSVLVTDIDRDDRWTAGWRKLNLAHNLRACLSIPIVGSNGKPLASASIFRRQPGDPTPANPELLHIVTHLAGIAIERNAAEQRERQLFIEAATANAQFRAFFEQGALFAGIMHIDGTLLEANRLSLEACGYTREQVVGKPYWEGPWWNRSPKLMEEIQQATLRAQAGEIFRATLSYFMADGSERIVDLILLPVKDQAGKVIFLVPTGTDITDRVRAEITVRETQSRLKSTLAAGEIGTWEFDLVNDVVWADANLARMFGVDPCEAAAGSPRAAFMKAIYPADLERVKQDVQQAVEVGESFGSEYRIVGADQSIRWVIARGRIERGEDGQALRLPGVLVDITERKQLEQELRQLAASLSEADERKNEFLATLAHELRNPLAPLRNGLEIMRLAGEDWAKHDRARKMMERQLTQLVRLVDDLLDVSRISRGKLELRTEPLDLRTVLDSAIETSGSLIDEMGHELSVNMPAGPVRVMADLTRLAQVFSNLLNNAAKYSPRNSHIRLLVEASDSEVIVRVQDDGIGIAADQLPRIFDLFSQIDNALKQSQGGLGIGLSLVKRFVEMHGGTIEGKSCGHGQGTEFIVRLPKLTGSPEMPFHSPAEPVTVRSTLRILVVDDNHDSADTLAMFLKIMGNQAHTAYDGEEAVAMAAEIAPDVILLDIGLPKLNGHEVCMRVRQQPGGKEILIIAQTGWGQEEDRQKSRESGFDHHLVKPVDPATLLKLLADLPAAARMQ